jgi:hypothetical protein
MVWDSMGFSGMQQSTQRILQSFKGVTHNIYCALFNCPRKMWGKDYPTAVGIAQSSVAASGFRPVKDSVTFKKWQCGRGLSEW